MTTPPSTIHRSPFTVSPWMRDELERRKQLWRDLFAGRPLERLPVDVRVTVPSPVPATVQAQFRDGDKQLAAALANALASWEHAPSSDGIPAMRPDVGCSCIYLFYCGGKPPVEWYREIMELMAPDVIVAPVFQVGPQEAESLCRELRPIAKEYASRMEWGWRAI